MAVVPVLESLGKASDRSELAPTTGHCKDVAREFESCGDFSYEGQSLWGSVPPHQGHHAITGWKLEKKGVEASLLRCYPKTGRTHQIRVHMSEMGHPILGDKQYGRSVRCRYNAMRCLLHAYELSFIHPTSGQKVQFQAPIPEDFQQAFNQLIGNTK